MGWRVAVATLVWLVAACSPVADESADRPAGEAWPEGWRSDVSAFLDGYLRATERGDTAAIRASFADPEDFVWIEDGAVRYQTADEVLAALGAFSGGMSVRTELEGLDMVRAGPSAVHAWATYETTMGDGPAAFRFGGAMSFVLVRRGAQWVILGGHVSSPAPDRG